MKGTTLPPGSLNRSMIYIECTFKVKVVQATQGPEKTVGGERIAIVQEINSDHIN